MIRIQNPISFAITADGTSSSMDVNLAESPINLPVIGKIPADFTGLTIGGLAGYSATLSGLVLTISFGSAPAAGNYGVGLTLLY